MQNWEFIHTDLKYKLIWVGLWLGSWKGCALPGPFIWMDGQTLISAWWWIGQKDWKSSWMLLTYGYEGVFHWAGPHMYPGSFTVVQYFLSRPPSYSIWKGPCSSLSREIGYLCYVGRSVSFIRPKVAQEYWTWRHDATLCTSVS